MRKGPSTRGRLRTVLGNDRQAGNLRRSRDRKEADAAARPSVGAEGWRKKTINTGCKRGRG